MGCGPGVFSFQLASLGSRVTGVDGSAEMIEACERRRRELEVPDVSFVRAELPLEDPAILEPADLVISSSVVEYVDDLDTVLAQFARLVRQGGTVIVSMPNRTSVSRTFQRIKFRLTGQPEVYRHIRHFATPRSLARRVAPYGLTLVERRYYTHFTRIASVLHRLRLPPSLTEDLFVAVFRRR
jgi:2-polyprenyl-3-methyl-5-hydroxy-6-metoxy-1,4-benzoquinol methylase